jgi:hypothetical protein
LPFVQQVYEVGGMRLSAALPLPALEPFRSRGEVALGLIFGTVETVRQPAVETFGGIARVGLRECAVRCRSTGAVDFLEVAGAGVFAVRTDRVVAQLAPGAAPEHVEAAVLGPVLALALARRGVFVLHASAVAIDAPGAGAAGGSSSTNGIATVGFLGDSGVGKSTLARLLDREGVRRVADDQLAVALPAYDQPVALPHFPQLKLRGEELLALGRLPRRLALRSLWSITPAAATARLVCRRLSPAAATAVLVRHTVAAALFSHEILSTHLELVGAFADRLAVGTLEVPRRLDVAAEVHAALLVEGAP